MRVRLSAEARVQFVGQRFGRLLVLAVAAVPRSSLVCRCDCGNVCTIRDLDLLKGIRSCGCLKREILQGLDLAGARFGRLLAIKRASKRGAGHRWFCRCDCGKTCIVQGGSLRNGGTRSCGCLKRGRSGPGFKNLTGQRFGRLLVIGLGRRRGRQNLITWQCHCDCGATVEVSGGSLRNGTRSCGCLNREARSTFIDLAGQRFGRLTVLARAHTKIEIFWLCRCDCGNSKVIAGRNLRDGDTRSCGCLKLEILRSRVKPRSQKSKIQQTKKELMQCLRKSTFDQTSLSLLANQLRGELRFLLQR
jgi:hypothetical protein